MHSLTYKFFFDIEGKASYFFPTHDCYQLTYSNEKNKIKRNVAKNSCLVKLTDIEKLPSLVDDTNSGNPGW